MGKECLCQFSLGLCGEVMKSFVHKRLRDRSQSGAQMAEFAPALLIFFMIILFPLINLIMLATGAGTAYLAAKQCASRAGTQATFTDARNVVVPESNTFVASGFGQFAKLAPIGGISGSGITLRIVSTPYGGGSSTINAANTPLAAAATPDTKTYEYRVDANFNIGPFMNLSAVPWIGGVPGLGPPVQMNFTATSSAEFPEGLNQ